MSDADAGDPFAAFGSDRTIVKPSAGRSAPAGGAAAAAPAPVAPAGPPGREIPLSLDTMMSGSFNGSVTITPASGLPVTVPVTLTISRTQVNFVAPYLAISGTSAEVIVRGDNFSQITVQDVKFGGSSAAAFNVVSDTEIRATHPALAAGTYAVQLQNPQGFNRSLANLVVIDPQVYAATTLSYPVAPNPLGTVGAVVSGAAGGPTGVAISVWISARLSARL